MAVVSKLMDTAFEKCEKFSQSNKQILSQGFVGACICAYTMHIAYPIVKKQWKKLQKTKKSNQKLIKINNNVQTVAIAKENQIYFNKEHIDDQHNDDDDDDFGDYNGEGLSRHPTNISVNSQIEKAEQLLAEIKLKSEIIGVNYEFMCQLKQLLNIMIPRFICRETILLTIHTLCLISRTFLSIYVAAMEGAIVKYIVRKDATNFALMLLKWFGIAIPATFINSMIRYLENKLALSFR